MQPPPAASRWPSWGFLYFFSNFSIFLHPFRVLLGAVPMGPVFIPAKTRCSPRCPLLSSQGKVARGHGRGKGGRGGPRTEITAKKLNKNNNNNKKKNPYHKARGLPSAAWVPEQEPHASPALPGYCRRQVTQHREGCAGIPRPRAPREMPPAHRRDPKRRKKKPGTRS